MENNQNYGNDYNTPQQQPPYYSTNYAPQPVVEQKASVGFAILSFLIPLAGLIIFLTQKSKRPKTAKVSGICALVSFLLNIIITIIIVVVSSTALIGASYGIAESLDDYSSSYSDDSLDYYDYTDDSYDSYDYGINSEDIILSRTILHLPMGNSDMMYVSSLPNGYSEDDLVYSSDDESIATVDASGQITTVSVGSTYINVETSDGKYYESMLLFVEE